MRTSEHYVPASWTSASTSITLGHRERVITVNATKNNNTDDIYLVADKLGWEYSGDINLEHGGLFYRPETWKAYGYAEAIEVQIACGTLFVTVGCINKAKECTDEVLRDQYAMEPCTELEIDYCRGYWGVEPGSDGNHCYPLVDTDNGEFFMVENRPISLDNLQGWIVARFLKS